MRGFTRRLVVIGGTTTADDWQIDYDGAPIGRVRLFDTGPKPRWNWHTWTYPASNGSEPTLEAALEAFAQAIMALPEGDRRRYP